jgi:hypothetical protein
MMILPKTEWTPEIYKGVTVSKTVQKCEGLRAVELLLAPITNFDDTDTCLSMFTIRLHRRNL